jgi:hypothetical protein
MKICCNLRGQILHRSRERDLGGHGGSVEAHVLYKQNASSLLVST